MSFDETIRFHSSRFLATMKGFVRRHSLCFPGESILVALSGGQDSVCLFHLFKCLAISWGLKIFVCHFEHGIRGDESLRDALFARELAAAWQTGFFSSSGDVKRFASDNRLSCQEAARVLRYRFFYTIAEQNGIDRIAIAHTATDQAEEFLIRMVRGAGLSGFSGIPVRNGLLIRPLLWAEREEIGNYLAERNIPFVTDSSNLDNNYLRNSIRNELLPFLKERYNPSIVRTLNRSVELLAVDHCALEEAADAAFVKVCRDTALDCRKLRQEEEAIRHRVIIKFLMKVGIPASKISSSHVMMIDRATMSRDRSVRQIHLPAGFTLYFNNGLLTNFSQ